VKFEAVIGLEIHAQLKTDSKIFCGCSTVFGAPPNSHGCPVCLGLPGSLPVLNRRVVDMAILAGLATGCTIAEKSIFARKHYFYPDLPQGYQISQYDRPLCEAGSITVEVDGTERRIGITRIHLEEDAGKLIHDQDTDSLFDVNRCSTPLIEIVSDPDIRSPGEAYAYLTALKRILEYLRVCDCNMEEGSLRCDANISIRPAGETRLGTKTELKNMNSFRGVEKALEYEIRRQIEVVESGGSVTQQTFQWDAAKNMTVMMRGKESAPDYRYFPEPDLVPLIVGRSWIETVRSQLPELPQERGKRFVAQYGLNVDHALVLTESRSVADYFEQTVQRCGDPKAAAGWVMTDVLRVCNDTRSAIESLAVTPEKLGALLVLVRDGTISAQAAKKVFNRIVEGGGNPAELVASMGLTQISDASSLEETVRKVVASFPAEVSRYKAGDKKLMAFFMGQAMKELKGKGNPKEMSSILAKLLG
jgi:aspartyl-tRNA(Asn)/glutamyl-tRNA(Gln) amidotransferase subunit B